MLINRACCAVLKATGDGNGDGAYNHVLITKDGAVATDGAVLAKLSLPDFSDPHPQKDRAAKADRIMHKSDMQLIRSMLSGGDPDDPVSAAIITDAGAVRVKGDDILELAVSRAQGKLPFENIDFPDISKVIPDKNRSGACRLTVATDKLAKIVAAAKQAGVEELLLEVPSEPDQAIRFDGINADAQHFLGVLQPVTPPE